MSWFRSQCIAKDRPHPRSGCFLQSAEPLLHTCGDEGPPPPPAGSSCKACEKGLPLADEVPLESDQAELADLGAAIKLWRGWRVSYRLREPEKEGVNTIITRISNKQKRSNDRPFTTDGTTRSKSMSERKAASDNIAAEIQARATVKAAAGLDKL